MPPQNSTYFKILKVYCDIPNLCAGHQPHPISYPAPP